MNAARLYGVNGSTDNVGCESYAGQYQTWLVRKLERELMFSESSSPRTEPSNYNALKNSKVIRNVGVENQGILWCAEQDDWNLA